MEKEAPECSKPPTSDWDTLKLALIYAIFEWMTLIQATENWRWTILNNKNKDFSRDFYGSIHNKQNKIHHQGFFVGLRQNLGFDDFNQETQPDFEHLRSLEMVKKNTNGDFSQYTSVIHRFRFGMVEKFPTFLTPGKIWRDRAAQQNMTVTLTVYSEKSHANDCGSCEYSEYRRNMNQW